MMNILVTGITGFVGRHLIVRLLRDGHQVTGIGRSRPPAYDPSFDSKQFAFIQADPTQPGDWQGRVGAAEAVINLAGANIFARWTRAYKQQIYDSRILTTRNLVAALPDDGQGRVFCSTSAAGYYGDRGDEVLSEAAEPGNDFLARVCIDWEKEAQKATDKGFRVVPTRFGVVLGKGGALAKMLPAYRLFLGGPMGDGQQWFPWIHIDDLVAALMFVVNTDTLQGPANFCAPESVRNTDFVQTLARLLNRPAFFRVPKAALNLAAGELGTLVLNSQRAVPEKLSAAGFNFSYATLEAALRDLV